MRHRNKNNNLSRTKAHREAMLSNMAVSLIKHREFIQQSQSKSIKNLC